MMHCPLFLTRHTTGKLLYSAIIGTVFLFINSGSFAQRIRARYPAALTNSFFSINAGYIGYSFSDKQLEPGYTAQSIHIPHAAIRILFGHEFNKYLSAQLSHMRPFGFVEYGNVNSGGTDYEVGMNLAGLTVKSALPISKKLAVQAEAGIGIITRGGFIVINTPGVKDAVFAGLLIGGGFEYRISKKWALTLNTVWSPPNDKINQPASVFYGIGFNYTLRKLPQEQVERNTGFIFPKQKVQLSYTTNLPGYGVNNFVSKDAHIFLGGDAQVKKGLSLKYQRNNFHTKKLFALDLGAGLS